jgi:uncharacterized protein YeaO (DUF488 family)
MIKVKRVYEPAERDDGMRFLIERLWPRGIKKKDLKADAWLKELGASNELRKWFGHDPSKWKQFQKRYFAELKTKPELLKQIKDASRHENVTLLFSAKDTEHNNAVALKTYLQK